MRSFIHGPALALTSAAALTGSSVIGSSAISRESDGKTVYDAGHYSTYAGPVKIKTKGTCVYWWGAYESQSWESGWLHCD
ncbi:hypothetical protein [Spirillospora sp. CA-128828]|uniref:hypothetical protein n=1 Tax=Spirillospora sp. CA-128828 TaxID=3240033 RepID=UPI003D8B6CAB